MTDTGAVNEPVDRGQEQHNPVRPLAGQEPREVIAALLQSWQGDDAGVFGMADQVLNKLRDEGYVVIDPDAFTCPVCGEEIAPFCIMHGFDGAGVGAYVKEALTEPYGNRGAGDEIRAAVREVPER